MRKTLHSVCASYFIDFSLNTLMFNCFPCSCFSILPLNFTLQILETRMRTATWNRFIIRKRYFSAWSDCEIFAETNYLNIGTYKSESSQIYAIVAQSADLRSPAENLEISVFVMDNETHILPLLQFFLSTF